LECRPVPCGQTKCRFGHRLEIDDEVDDYETLCDFCGASILLLDKWWFEDSECDFDICKKCHSKLPANLIS